MKKSFRFVSLLNLIVLAVIGCGEPRQPSADETGSPPNIIFILTDDLGYGDIGALYQKRRADEGLPFHKTPHLDKMAGEGILLTRHYVGAPVCAPSRASLLQGVHQGHANVRNNQFDKALSNNHNLATVLKEAGYATGLVGKYGLQGRGGDSPQTWEAYPTKRGFDHFFGYVRHRDGHNHYPAHEVRERPAVELYAGPREISSQLRGAYTTDLFTAVAKKWIIEQKDTGQPFFLYLAYDTPHAGLEVAPAPYPEGGGLKGGVQWIGDEGHIINTADSTIDDYIHPDYAGRDWPQPQKRFASMVRRIDNGVGDLMQLLQDLGIDEHTLVVFTSDNGPHRESYGYGPYDPTFFDSFGPLDGIKRDTWEGGIRVPTIVRWPGQIPAGSASDAPGGFHDWLPTFADLSGLPAPARTDGVSLLPLLTGEGTPNESEVYIEYSQGGTTPDYSEFEGSRQGQRRGQMQVIYLDGYKGVRYDIASAGDDFRIYDTRKDPSETKDLAGKSDRFKDLQERMKDRVLQIRRPNESAPRPYDNALIPAVEKKQLSISKGIEWKVYDGIFSWVPKITNMNPAATGQAEAPDISVHTRNNQVSYFAGYIRVPENGEYTFSLETDSGALLRIHEATLIDADYGYKAGTEKSGTVNLEAGLHPLRLYYIKKEQSESFMSLKWSGPGITEQPIPAHVFFRDNKQDD